MQLQSLFVAIWVNTQGALEAYEENVDGGSPTTPDASIFGHGSNPALQSATTWENISYWMFAT